MKPEDEYVEYRRERPEEQTLHLTRPLGSVLPVQFTSSVGKPSVDSEGEVETASSFEVNTVAEVEQPLPNLSSQLFPDTFWKPEQAASRPFLLSSLAAFLILGLVLKRREETRSGPIEINRKEAFNSGGNSFVDLFEEVATLGHTIVLVIPILHELGSIGFCIPSAVSPRVERSRVEVFSAMAKELQSRIDLSSKLLRRVDHSTLLQVSNILRVPVKIPPRLVRILAPSEVAEEVVMLSSEEWSIEQFCARVCELRDTPASLTINNSHDFLVTISN